MKVSKLFREFFKSEKSAGLILIAATLLSLILANSALGNDYHHFWSINVFNHSLEYWINDGLMAIFFLLIGLELEREIYKGELSNIKEAALPVFAAIGGMVVPASIYLLFNFGTSTQSGSGIPMATDIAFALGILSLLGNKVPTSLKVFLTALAVIDDLGAILVIAVLYTKTLYWSNLLIALGIFLLLIFFNRMRVYHLWLYLLGGIFMWYFMLNSGVHATITGVLLAFAIPFGNGSKKTPSYKLQHFLHKPVAYIILPIFALANTGIMLTGNFLNELSNPYSLGIMFGLVIGKPLGIFLFTYLVCFLGLAKLPHGLNWKSIFGVGLLGGIGFTMSIFITLLAFDSQVVIDSAKLVILLSSFVAGVLGFVVLKFQLKEKLLNDDNL